MMDENEISKAIVKSKQTIKEIARVFNIDLVDAEDLLMEATEFPLTSKEDIFSCIAVILYKEYLE